MRQRIAEAPSLKGIQLLQRLSSEERYDLEQHCSYRHVLPGQVVVDRASASGAVFFLVSGTARVVHYVTVVTATGGAANEPTQPTSEEITIATIGAGDTIGEISAIDGQGRSASVIADDPCLVAELDGQEFQELITRRGDVALDLLKRWAVTIRRLSDKVSYLSTGSPDQRVFSELLRLTRQDALGKWTIKDLPSHQDLAKWAQTSKQVVATCIAEIVLRGVAERRTKTLHIFDFEALRRLAETPSH